MTNRGFVDRMIPSHIKIAPVYIIYCRHRTVSGLLCGLTGVAKQYHRLILRTTEPCLADMLVPLIRAHRLSFLLSLSLYRERLLTNFEDDKVIFYCYTISYRTLVFSFSVCVPSSFLGGGGQSKSLRVENP